MKATLLKHYGKILLTILALGIGSYFHVDVGSVVGQIGKLFPDTAATSVSAPAPAATDSDAGL